MNIKKFLYLKLLIAVTINILTVPVANCGRRNNGNYQKSKNTLSARKFKCRKKRKEQIQESSSLRNMDKQFADYVSEYTRNNCLEGSAKKWGKEKKKMNIAQFIAGAIRSIFLKPTSSPSAKIIMTLFVIACLIKQIKALEVKDPQYYSSNFPPNTVELLTEASAAVNIENKPLPKFLIKRCKNIKNGGYSSFETLKKAIEGGDIQQFRWLIENCNEDINAAVDTKGSTLLIKFTESKNIEAMQEILKHPDLDINKVNKDGNAALHVAAKKTSSESTTKAIQEILKHPDLDINKASVNKYGRTALHLAVIGMRKIMSLKEILKHPKIDIDKTDNYGDTALHIAVRFQTNYVQKLLNEDANPNITNNKNETPYDIAKQKTNKEEMIKLLTKPKNYEERTRHKKSIEKTRERLKQLEEKYNELYIT